MTASRPSADLPVPDAALQALDGIIARASHDGSWGDDLGGRAAVNWIARPVVAQFLRDLAAGHDRVSGGFLAELADQLDGGGKS